MQTLPEEALLIWTLAENGQSILQFTRRESIFQFYQPPCKWGDMWASRAEYQNTHSGKRVEATENEMKTKKNCGRYDYVSERNTNLKSVCSFFYFFNEKVDLINITHFKWSGKSMASSQSRKCLSSCKILKIFYWTYVDINTILNNWQRAEVSAISMIFNLFWIMWSIRLPAKNTESVAQVLLTKNVL